MKKVLQQYWIIASLIVFCVFLYNYAQAANNYSAICSFIDKFATEPVQNCEEIINENGSVNLKPDKENEIIDYIKENTNWEEKMSYPLTDGGSRDVYYYDQKTNLTINLFFQWDMSEGIRKSINAKFYKGDLTVFLVPGKEDQYCIDRGGNQSGQDVYLMMV